MRIIQFFLLFFAELVSAGTDEVGESNLEKRMARLETAMEAQNAEFQKMTEVNKDLVEDNKNILEENDNLRREMTALRKDVDEIEAVVLTPFSRMYRIFARFSGHGLQKFTENITVILKTRNVKIAGPFLLEKYWK